MAKEYGQKLKIIYVLDILKKYSDEKHPVTAEFIVNELQKYDVKAERKSIYTDISALSDYGFDIIKSGYPRGWFLASREFEIPEIYLLADAVRTAKFISAAKTRKLIKKLGSFVSVYQLAEREKKVYFSENSKCKNEEIFYSIDVINRAITEHKKIRFNYITRVLSADRTVDRKTKKMKISPYALVWHDDHYYILGNYEKYDNILHLRLDRMRKVEITEETARHFSEVTPYTDHFNTPDYTDKLFGMYSGELTETELACNKKIIEQVVDRFGENIFIKNVTENEFSFSVTAAISEALVTWILNFGQDIKVITPENLREMVKNRAKEVLKLYCDIEK